MDDLFPVLTDNLNPYDCPRNSTLVLEASLSSSSSPIKRPSTRTTHSNIPICLDDTSFLNGRRIMAPEVILTFYGSALKLGMEMGKARDLEGRGNWIWMCWGVLERRRTISSLFNSSLNKGPVVHEIISCLNNVSIPRIWTSRSRSSLSFMWL